MLRPDGIKLQYPQENDPKTVFWKVLYRVRIRGSEQNPNSGGNVRTRNQSRSIEAGVSEVEDHGEEDTKMKWSEHEISKSDKKELKTQKRERMSALRGQQENAINGRQKDSVQKEMQFPPRRQWGRKESTVVLSCPEVADTKWRKKTPSEAAVLQEGSIKKRADITLLGNCTNPSCDYWHAPVCQGNKTASGCNFGEKCVLRHTEVDSQHSEKPKKSGGKGSVASSLKNSKESGCVLQDVEPPKSKSILRKSPKFLGSKRSVQFSKGTPRHVTSRERKGPSQGVIEKCEPHERSPYAPQFEDRTQEETLQQERCARWQSQEMAKHVRKLNDKDTATFFSPAEVWSLPAPSSKNPEEG